MSISKRRVSQGVIGSPYFPSYSICDEETRRALIDTSIAEYDRSNVFICPLSRECEAQGRVCSGCGLVALVDTLGMLKEQIFVVTEGISEGFEK